jgi:hypothetical protein
VVAIEAAKLVAVVPAEAASVMATVVEYDGLAVMATADMSFM